jgi:Rieske Fe-S protein
VVRTTPSTSKNGRRELMAKRRGFLKAVFGGVTAFIAVPFSRSASQVVEEEIQAAAPGSLSVQSQDSTSVQPTDSTDVSEEGFRAVEIPLDAVKELGEVGGSKLLKINGNQILVVRESEESIRAFQSECTHKNTAVKYDKKKRLVRCPAHGSRFDLEGNVLRGPAKHPLRTFEARLSGDRIVLVLED